MTQIKNKRNTSKSPSSPGATTTWCCLPFGLAIQIVSSWSRTNIGVWLRSPCGDIIGKLWTILAKDRPLGRPCLRANLMANLMWWPKMFHISRIWSHHGHSILLAIEKWVWNPPLLSTCTISLNCQNSKFRECKLIKSHWRSMTSLAIALGEVVVISHVRVACPKPLAKKPTTPKILNLTRKYMKHRESYSHLVSSTPPTARPTKKIMKNIEKPWEIKPKTKNITTSTFKISHGTPKSHPSPHQKPPKPPKPKTEPRGTWSGFSPPKDDGILFSNSTTSGGSGAKHGRPLDRACDHLGGR